MRGKGQTLLCVGRGEECDIGSTGVYLRSGRAIRTQAALLPVVSAGSWVRLMPPENSESPGGQRLRKQPHKTLRRPGPGAGPEMRGGNGVKKEQEKN